MMAAERSWPKRLLCSVGLDCFYDVSSESQMSLLCRLTTQFIDADDAFITRLSLLQRTNQHIAVVGGDEGHYTPQLAFVFRGLKRPKRAVEYGGSLRGLCRVECTLMANETIGEHMVALVLMCLIGIRPARLRSIEQREAQGVVGGLVPSVA